MTARKALQKTRRKAIRKVSSELSLEDEIEDVQEAYVKRLCKAHTPDAVRSLVEISSATRRKCEPNPKDYFEIETDEDGEPIRYEWTASARVTASKALLEYAHGRPTAQPTAHGGMGGGGIKVVIHQYGEGKPFQEIDITPVMGTIESGDTPSERMDS